MRKSADESSDGSYWVFSEGKEKNTDLVPGVDAKKDSNEICLTARVVWLDAHTFLDFSIPEDADDFGCF